MSPLGAELASLRSAATERRPARAGRLRFTLARLGGETVALAATGDGARTAGERLGELLAAARPRRLLVLGVAGGLAPRLAEGALIAAERVIDEDGREAPRPDRAWLAQALRNGKLSGGTVVTTGAIQVTPEDKARLLGRALFPMHPAVADLETAAYARAAAAAGVPYLAVRVVLDPAGETLPLDFNRCRNAGGGVSAVRVLGLALRHPSSLPSLWNLRRRMRRCAQRLAEVAQGLIAEDGAAGEAR